MTTEVAAPTTPTALQPPAALERRLRKLERDNAVLKSVVFVLVLVALAGGVWYAASQDFHQPLRREAVYTGDLSVDQPSGGAAAYINGRDQAAFTLVTDGDRARILGEKDGAGLSLFAIDPKSKYRSTIPSATLQVGDDGTRALRLYDEGGVARAALTYTWRGPRLDFFDATGRSRLAIGMDAQDRPSISAWDALGNPVSLR